LGDGANLLLHNFDAFEFRAIVEGREGRHGSDGGLYVWRDQCGLAKMLSPMDDTMARGRDF